MERAQILFCILFKFLTVLLSDHRLFAFVRPQRDSPVVIQVVFQLLLLLEQLFISYGDRSNDQLLQYYGFVERSYVIQIHVKTMEGPA